MDKEYLGYPVPEKIQKAFLTMFKNMRYLKIVFEGEHRKVLKDLISLKVDHFLQKKTASTLLLTAANTLNYSLTSANIGKVFLILLTIGDPQNPFLNRPRHILNQNDTEKNLARYLNMMRDFADMKNYARELGFPRDEDDKIRKQLLASLIPSDDTRR